MIQQVHPMAQKWKDDGTKTLPSQQCFVGEWHSRA